MVALNGKFQSPVLEFVLFSTFVNGLTIKLSDGMKVGGIVYVE